MKHIPVIFPLLLVVVLLTTAFFGAYAIAEAAVNGQRAITPEQALPSSASGADASDPNANFEWYENVAIWVCPLH